MMTRRSAVLMGLGLGGAAALSAGAKDFWTGKKAADWTDGEIQQMLNKSPWAKDAAIFDSAAHKGMSTAPRTSAASPRSGGRTSTPGTPAPTPGYSATWKAIVRWESALPVLEAMKAARNKDAEENYILALIGDIPGVGVPSDDDEPAERKAKMDNLVENTQLERRDDPLELQRVKIAPKTPLSPAGTLFYFSRVLPIMPQDKQITFVTKVGPLEVKCKFTLRDMLYRGNLEL
ncbi:MAG: hypothetical protein M3N41_05390 [Acidobacteriota bacterium]|nr:hypothetical protein [Acidobacteriota bacterium]